VADVDYLTAILPSVGVLFLFVLAIRAMFQADRRERLAQAKLERQELAGAADSAPAPRVDPPN
jgi:ABC-type uncharacterized transport system YnjBCD ATPase subunit